VDRAHDLALRGDPDLLGAVNFAFDEAFDDHRIGVDFSFDERAFLQMDDAAREAFQLAQDVAEQMKFAFDFDGADDLDFGCDQRDFIWFHSENSGS